jgi:hypothetical protein
MWAQRWNAGEYLPCGCVVQAERRWGDLTVPSRLTVGWRSGTKRQAPFFRCELQTLAAENH